MTNDPHRLLPLSEPVFQILISLAARDLHGYAIMREVEKRTDGRVTLSTSTLYGALQRIMRDDLVERSEAPVDADSGDERRRYYRVTDFGREVVAAEARRIDELATLLRERDLLRDRGTRA